MSNRNSPLEWKVFKYRKTVNSKGNEIFVQGQDNLVVNEKKEHEPLI